MENVFNVVYSWQTSAVYSHTRFPRFLQIKPVHLLQIIEGFLAVFSGAFRPPPQNKYIGSSKRRQDISNEKERGGIDASVRYWFRTVFQYTKNLQRLRQDTLVNTEDNNRCCECHEAPISSSNLCVRNYSSYNILAGTVK
jgi:hypothetical protein